MSDDRNHALERSRDDDPGTLENVLAQCEDGSQQTEYGSEDGRDNICHGRDERANSGGGVRHCEKVVWLVVVRGREWGIVGKSSMERSVVYVVRGR